MGQIEGYLPYCWLGIGDDDKEQAYHAMGLENPCPQLQLGRKENVAG